jgi:uncharacterized protein YdiU (UPF0061 family)
VIAELDNIAKQLQQANALVIFLRPKIEEIWERIAVDDDWQPLYEAIAAMKK